MASPIWRPKSGKTGVGFSLQLFGQQELQQTLGTLRTQAAGRVARSGLKAALVVMGRAIRQGVNAATIPPTKGVMTRAQRRSAVARIKRTVRMSVGNRLRRLGKSLLGQHTGKAGFAVGKKQQDLPKRSGRKGVGIGYRNVHWFAMGTKDRYIKSGPRAGQWTGKMPAYFKTTVATSVLSSSGAAEIAMGMAMLRTLNREAIKARSSSILP